MSLTRAHSGQVPLRPLLPQVLLLWLCVSLSGERQKISEMAALHFCSISLQPLLL